MKKFTFIFMFYNLKETGLSGSESDHVEEVHNQLLNCRIDPSINIIVVRHTPEKTEGPVNKSYTNTIVTSIEANHGAEKNLVKPLFNFGARNVGDADSLAGILLLIKAKYEAEKFIIFTYDHSNFIGHLTTRLAIGRNYLKIMLDEKVTRNNLQELVNALHTQPVGDNDAAASPFEILRQQYEFTRVQNFDMLTNDELAKAIHRAFLLNPLEVPKKQKPVEAIFFNTCYTGCLDNLFIYAGRVNYIVASEGETYFNSFNIDKVISYFLEQDKSPAQAVKKCINNFAEDFELLNPGIQDHNKMVLAAYDLTAAEHMSFREEFKNKFNSLIAGFMKDINKVYTVVSGKAMTGIWPDCFYVYNESAPSAPDKIPNETFTYCYDFFHFFKVLSESNELAEYRRDIDDLISFIASKEMRIFKGNLVRDSFIGLSLFFPFDFENIGEKKQAQVAHSYSFYSAFKNEFAKETFWPEFLQLYQKQIK